MRHMVAAAFFFSLMSLAVKAPGTERPTAQVVFAAARGLFLFGEVPDTAGVAGAVLVFAGIVIVASKHHHAVAPAGGGSAPYR